MVEEWLSALQMAQVTSDRWEHARHHPLACSGALV